MSLYLSAGTVIGSQYAGFVQIVLSSLWCRVSLKYYNLCQITVDVSEESVDDLSD